MRFTAAAILCAAAFSAVLGWHRAPPNEAPGIGSDVPALSPAPVEWGPESRYPQFFPLSPGQLQLLRDLGIDSETVEGRHGEAAAVAAQLKAVQAELAQPESLPQRRGIRSGAGMIVLRLSRPSAAPRAVVRLRAGWLYEVAQLPNGLWRTRQLTEFRPSMIDTVDLTGDGRPEITAGMLSGSGAFLTLQVFSWDDRGIWEIHHSTGAVEPGQYGFYDAEGDGRRELYIDTAAGHGLFKPGVHGPYLRDRLIYRYDGRSYRLSARYRFATPFYHLNRYLYFACRGEWRRAAAHAEPGARVDRRLAAWLGEGGLRGGDHEPFINDSMAFQKENRGFRAEFGPTGRLVTIRSLEPAANWPAPQKCGE